MMAAVAVIGGVNHLYLKTRLLEELELELDRRALGIARQTALGATELILYGDIVGLQKLLDSTKVANPEFAYIFVVDRAGQVIAHTFDGRFPAPLRFINRHREPEGYTMTRLQVLGETFRDLALPLQTAGLGQLRLGVRDKRILDIIARISGEVILFLIAGTLLAATGAYLFTWAGLKPFATIVSTLRNFEPGKRREAIVLGRDDEIGDLAQQINEITKRLDATQSQIMRTERLASVGVMASGIAHEINNPITGIQNCLRRIQAKPDNRAQIEEYVDVMLTATEHIAQVVRGLLDFSKGRPQRFARVDLRTVVGRSLELATLRLNQKQIRVERIERDEPVWAVGDSSQLTQVVVNLVLNSIDAMDAGGILELQCMEVGAKPYIRITDQGCGIAPSDLERVFDPFYSTKGAGKGTGLGLAVSHNIVEENGGRLEITSSLGKGTTATVWLDRNPHGGRTDEPT